MDIVYNVVYFGSKKRLENIVKKFNNKIGNIKIYDGPGIGYKSIEIKNTTRFKTLALENELDKRKIRYDSPIFYY